MFTAGRASTFGLGARLALGHSLLRDLRDFVIPCLGNHSLVTGRPPVRAGSGAYTGAGGRFGLARTFVRAAALEDEYAQPTGHTGDITLFCVGRIDSGVAGTQRLVNLRSSGTSRFWIGENSSSRYAGVSVPNGGSSVAAQESTGSFGSDCVLVLRLSGTSLTFWINGVQVGSGTQSVNNFSDVTHLELGTTGFLAGPDGRVYAAGWLARAWSDAEIVAFSAAPTSVLRPRKLWIPTPSAGVVRAAPRFERVQRCAPKNPRPSTLARSKFAHLWIFGHQRAAADLIGKTPVVTSVSDASLSRAATPFGVGLANNSSTTGFTATNGAYEILQEAPHGNWSMVAVVTLSRDSVNYGSDEMIVAAGGSGSTNSISFYTTRAADLSGTLSMSVKLVSGVLTKTFSFSSADAGTTWFLGVSRRGAEFVFYATRLDAVGSAASANVQTHNSSSDLATVDNNFRMLGGNTVFSTNHLHLTAVGRGTFDAVDMARLAANPWALTLGDRALPDRWYYGSAEAAALTAAVTVSGSTTGDLTTAITLAAGATATATTTGALTTAITLAAGATATGAATGDLTTAITLAAGATATATATGDLTTAIVLQAAATAVVSATASFEGSAAQFNADVTVSVTAAGALTTAIPLAGATAVSATAAGQLTTAIPLTAAAAVTVTATGVMAGDAAALAGALTVTCTAAGALTTSIALSGAAQAAATATAQLLTQIRMQAALTVAALASGELTSELQPNLGDPAHQIFVGPHYEAIRVAAHADTVVVPFEVERVSV